MPLRRWFASHGLPGWYSWMVLFLLTISSIGISILINAKLLHRTIEANRRAEIVQGEQVRRATCLVVIAQDNAFHEPQSTPVTEAGRRAATAWHYLRTTLRCDQQ